MRVTWSLFVEAFNLMIDTISAGIEPLAVRIYLAELTLPTGIPAMSF
ncbi:MAG: hypothetical protein NW224_16445 [Leptolyngbyaceae cyanobacterium bins.302]|nr:hypothetical protein [Leptolyngbyaceae cyanobacterium bins.302]